MDCIVHLSLDFMVCIVLKRLGQVRDGQRLAPLAETALELVAGGHADATKSGVSSSTPMHGTTKRTTVTMVPTILEGGEARSASDETSVGCHVAPPPVTCTQGGGHGRIQGPSGAPHRVLSVKRPPAARGGGGTRLSRHPFDSPPPLEGWAVRRRASPAHPVAGGDDAAHEIQDTHTACTSRAFLHVAPASSHLES